MPKLQDHSSTVIVSVHCFDNIVNQEGSFVASMGISELRILKQGSPIFRTTGSINLLK